MAITNFISTVWSENLLKQLDCKYIGVSHCNRDFEGDIKNKGSAVKICGVGAVTVSDYTKNSDMDAPETLDDYEATLEIDQAKYFNFQIDDVDKAQSNPKLMDEAMRNAASALANQADLYVYSLANQTEYEFFSERTTIDNIFDIVLDAKTHMMRSNVNNADEIVIEVSPEIANLITKAKLYTSTDNYNAMEEGFVGNLAGSKVYVSNNIVVDDEGYHKCLMRTKRAVAFAEQISEVEAYRPEKRFADAVKGLHLYGAKIVYPEEFVVLNLKLSD